MAAVFYNLLNKEGVDVTATYTPASQNPSIVSGLGIADPSSGPPFLPGEHVLGEFGTEWVFVLASAAIAQYACVAIDANFNATPMTQTLALTLTPEVGFAQVAIASGSYGWVALRGSQLTFLTKGATAKNTALRVSTSAGVLVSTGTSAAWLVTGTFTTTSYASTSTIGRQGVSFWPRIGS